MIKLAIIGAGSVVFSRNLTGDLLSYPEFRQATFCYMDIDSDRAQVAAGLCRRLALAADAKPVIQCTTNRRCALEGADVVINVVQIGGFGSTLVDFEIPRKYGLNFTIADTTGPGGIMRALRTWPMLQGLCRDMSELCPNATLLNYSNPMSMNMKAINALGITRAVGLCHSVQSTLHVLARYLGEPADAITYTCAGINHMAFFLTLARDGQDLYPRLFAAMHDPRVYNTNKVRFELLKLLGYFVTESSEHNAEYNPWFIPRGAKAIARHNIPIDEYLRRCDAATREFEHMRELSVATQPLAHRHSGEYCAHIVRALLGGAPARIYGNMPNGHAIANLPADAIVEAPTRVDASGIHFEPVGHLPPQLVAYVQPHVSQQELFLRAVLEGRRDCIYQAMAFDPLTAASLSLDNIVQLCDELIAAHGKLLPPLVKTARFGFASHPSLPTVDVQQLQANRRAEQERMQRGAVKQWRLIGPMFPTHGSELSLATPTAIEHSGWLTPDGSPADTTLWRQAEADPRGLVDLSQHLGRHEWAIAYGWACVPVACACETTLRCGSDDGIKIWVNGSLVHEHEIGRAFTPCEDAIPIQLRAGDNHIVVKIDNYTGDWAFGVYLDALAANA
ncbi:MAG: alpha-galactosidase [Phycisphaerales bacterium]|nr:alpha-galactosidase [Phycisphaerales bacterium]